VLASVGVVTRTFSRLKLSGCVVEGFQIAWPNNDLVQTGNS
jgi:hypothetical protein